MGKNMQIKESGKNKYAETKRIIRTVMTEKQLVLFVGAGASVDAGIPLWGNAIKQISEKLDRQQKTNDYLLIPQFYYNSRGQKEYTELMRSVFRYNDKLEPQPIHKAIISFGVDTIITTNYDHLIEQAAEDAGEFMQVISQDIDLPYRKAGKELVKMHGDFEHDNFVLKEDDYLHYHKNFKLIENYVKSLIGTKTVLFLGYSLNDPDVKQIFSWVKEILDGHFQRAYLINTERHPDQNEEAYFRHLGVNIIYASELFDGDSDNQSLKLLSTVNYLLDDEKAEKGVIENLYDYLKPFSSLNRTYRKYVENAFNNLTGKMGRLITLRISNENYVEYSQNHVTDEEKCFLNELNNASKGKSDDQRIQIIYSALKKSEVKGARELVKEGNEYRWVKNDFPKDNEPEWIESIFNFDYKKLKDLKDYNLKILSESRPELYLEQAYIAAFLYDYLTAYYCLDNAARYFYRRREYAWYFIALWDKRNVAQIIRIDLFHRDNIDKATLENIERDYESLDLDKTLQTIPDLGNKNNTFLHDLNNFKFASDLFYDVVSTSMKSNSEANERYFLYAGLPAYEKLRQQVYDYYLYGIYNYLLVDRYRENNEIYELFARGIFASVAAPNIDLTDSESGFGNSRNIHVDALNGKDIHLILRYIESKNLRKLISEAGINVIEVDEEGKKYIAKIAETIPEAFSPGAYGSEDIFWRFLCFISHTNIEESVAISVLNTLAHLPQGQYAFDKHDSLIEFTNALYSQELYKSKEVCQAIISLEKMLIEVISANSGVSNSYKGAIVSLASIAKEGGYPFSDTNTIRKILCEEFYLLLPSLYDSCSEEIKQIIDNEFNNWKCLDTDKDYQIYSSAVLAKIIEPNKEVEERSLNYLDKEIENRKKQKAQGYRSFPEGILENDIVNLYLSGLIIEKEKFKSVVSKSDDEFTLWIINSDEYDYDKFKLSWLNHCYPSLLKKLSDDEVVRKSVVAVYKKNYSKEYIDRKTNKIIVKYFI